MRFFLKYLKKFTTSLQYIFVYLTPIRTHQVERQMLLSAAFSWSIEDHIYTGVFGKVRTIYCINLHSILNTSQHSLPEITSYEFQHKWEEMQEHITPSMSLTVSTSDVTVRPALFLKRLKRQSLGTMSGHPTVAIKRREGSFTSRNKKGSSWGLKKSVTTEKTSKENYSIPT